MNVALVFMNDTPVIGRGAGYIAGALLAAGYPVSFFDSYYDAIGIIAAKVIDGSYDILMISAMTMNFPMALTLIHEVKKSKNMPVLVGGIHPTITGASLLDRYPEIDYLCIGEGESMVKDFLRHYATDALFDVQNLCYRKNGTTYSNQVRPPEDLSTLPEFPWHFFRKESIVGTDGGLLYVTASRGCPYNCTYCCNGIYLKYYGKKYIRFRPIDRVIEELQLLKKAYHPHLFYFGDEMILADRDNAMELFSNVKNKVDVPYGLMARVEYVTPEIAGHLKKTGCKYVAMGIECGDDHFRREHLNRFHSNEQIELAFSLLRKAGIFRASFNIIGYPFDNDDALTRETIRLNKRVKPDYAYFTIFYPFPGTKLYDRCIELDLLDKERIEKTRQYYEESVLKNVSLKKKCDRITRSNNSAIPFGDLLPIEVSGRGRGYRLLMKLKYRCMTPIKKTAKLMLGKRGADWVRAHRKSRQMSGAS